MCSLRRRSGWVKLAALGLFLLACGGRSAWAWGRIQHRASARLAESRLRPGALAALRGLLEPGESLADASTWADEVRRARRLTAAWHYVNVPISEPGYNDQFCPPGGCVVSKIPELARVVADSTVPRGHRREALRFLVHLVQDLHQPLHVGNRNDRGGNDLQVQFWRRGTNLHHVWDRDLVERSDPDEQALARVLSALAEGPISEVWAMGTPVDWATESLNAARLAYLRPEDGLPLERGARLGAAYFESNLPIARLRLAQSGVRLAAILNDTLDPLQ